MDNIMNTIGYAMKRWGPRGVTNFALALSLLISIIALTVVYTRPVPSIIPATTETKIVAATGEVGFPVSTFCEDSRTTVKVFPAPDASGLTYSLTRIAGGVVETVVVVAGSTGDNPTAKWYYDTPVGQEGEPAIVDGKAFDCIERKAR